MYNQGDILLIPIPFTDLTSSKKRPVLVLSNDKYNSLTDDIIVVAITSNIKGKFTEIMITNTDMKEGNLKTNSCVRVDKLYTLSQAIVIKNFGKINDDILDKVRIKLNNIVS